MDNDEPFLSRWSRRKLEAKEDAPAGAPQAAELPAAAPGAPPVAATEPTAVAAAKSTAVPTAEPASPESPRGISAEYREFFDPKVDEKLRRTALKKLFNDPHFNVMDGLDTYIDDYSKPDPIPEAMLRQLHQAKGLFLFDDEKQAGESASDVALTAAGGTGPAAPVAEADMSKLPDPPAASVPEELAGAATIAAPAQLGEDIRESKKVISESPQ